MGKSLLSSPTMQTPVLVLYLVSTLCTSLTVCGVCGPPECGVVCGSGDQCVEDADVTCCCTPCCARWSCGSGCPHTRPEFNSPCPPGEEYPEIAMQCMDGMWEGYHVDTLCILGLAPPC